MKVNLHTHTARCMHAVGTDEEYVLAALDRGLKTLGFSDHAPHLYPDGYVSTVRMTPAQLPEYAESIRALQKKYTGKINIHLGAEVEYFPAMFDSTLSMLLDNGIEYMILGQHHIGNEIGQPHSAKPTEDEKVLQCYCDQVIAGMETGHFTYLAHPDFINFVGDRKVYEYHMRRVCRCAKEGGIPLEVNMLGLRQGRHYPCDRFFSIVAEENCPVVIGSDAHAPEQVLLSENEVQALAFIERFGLDLITEPKLQKI